MAQQQNVPQYTFSQLVLAVEQLKKVTEQLNENSKNLDMRILTLEGNKQKPLPSQPSVESEDEEDEPSPSAPPEVPMSTSELAIQKEAKLIAELEKSKEKEKQEERLAVKKTHSVEKQGVHSK